MVKRFVDEVRTAGCEGKAEDVEIGLGEDAETGR